MHRFKVDEMSCGHCEAAVKRAILAIDPMAQVTVDLASGRVEIESSGPADPLIAAIEAAGYPARPDARA